MKTALVIALLWCVVAPLPPALGAEGSPPPLRRGKFTLTEDDRAWWSLQPVRRPAIPAVRGTNAVANPIDAFLLSRLESGRLSFSRPATRRELIRRAYFDLIGLPPTPEAVTAFERDSSAGAWEKLIDDLLARPQYGERWARHWLDLVRFAESNGYERDGAKPNAWRYRDYVIQAFNRDKPYDQFVREQLAGDELGGAFDPEAIVATGYYRLHVWDDEPDSALVAEFDDLDDVMVTTGASFLGLTLGCARCHDHKFDPISQRDYYQVLAFIRSINPYGQPHTGGGGRGTGHITRPLAPPSAVAAWEQGRDARRAALSARLHATQDPAGKKDIEAQLRAVDAEAPPYGTALAVVEDPPKPTFVLHRGDVSSPGAEVQPAFPAIFNETSASAADAVTNVSTNRRLALARWIARPENPLTARVLVNRLWQHHFGRGLVRTPNDFGRTGLPPTHPELLDYLASEFVAGGWHIKRLQKLILMSRAYQMSSRADRREALAADEANECYWRQNPRRLEAEALRDTVLAVCGNLNGKAGGPSFFPTLAQEVHGTQDSAGKGWGESAPDEQNRRTIYAFVKRALVPPLVESFDCPSTTVPVGVRPVTTVAPQALMLLNDEWMQKEGEQFAERLRREAGPDDESRLARAFALALQRSPASAERRLALRQLAEQRRLAPAPGTSAGENAAWRAWCIALLNVNELIYID